MRNAKVDENHVEIVRGLRAIGATVQSLAALGRGAPDLLVGKGGANYLLEVKNSDMPPSKRRLTEAEAIWHQTWRGSVWIVESLDDALKAIGAT